MYYVTDNEIQICIMLLLLVVPIINLVLISNRNIIKQIIK